MAAIKGGEVVTRISVDSSRAAVVMIHAYPNLSAVLCLLPTLRVAKSKVEEILGASSSVSNDLRLVVVVHQ